MKKLLDTLLGDDQIPTTALTTCEVEDSTKLTNFENKCPGCSELGTCQEIGMDFDTDLINSFEPIIAETLNDFNPASM